MLSVENFPGQLCGGPVGLKLLPLQVEGEEEALALVEGEEEVLALVEGEEEAWALVETVVLTLVEEAWARVWDVMLDTAEGEEAALATVKLVDAEAWALVPMVLLGAAGDLALLPALLAGPPPPRNLTIPNVEEAWATAWARVWGPMVATLEGAKVVLVTEAWALVLGAAGDMALLRALLAGPPRNLTIPNGVADAEDPVQPASCHSSRHCPRALALPHLTEAPRLPEAEEIPWAQAKATWYFSSGVLLATRPNSALDRFAAPKHVIH